MHTKNCKGNILIVALILIVVVSGLVVVASNVTNNSARFTDRSRDFVSAQAAAEGAVDHAFAIWKRRINSQNRAIDTTTANANLAAPTFTDYTYASAGEDGPLKIEALDEYGAPIANPTKVTVDLPSYPGWRGNTYSYSARAKVRQTGVTGGPAVGVKRQFQYSEVPLFQAMFFFENDLEFYRPATMIVSGLVHTNAMAYLSQGAGLPLTFQDDVSYVTGYSTTTAPPYANLWSGYVPNDAATPVFEDGIANQLHQVPRFEPLGSEPAAVINTADANPNNDSFRELIEPPNSSYSDPPEIAKRRMYNKAGIRININGSTVTVTGQNGTSLLSSQQMGIASAVSASTTIYDSREGKNVDVRTLDIATLRTAMGSTGISGFNNVIYINDTTPLTTGNMEPKAIRLKNGGILPTAGLTVASENAIYIQGDYNTGTTSSPTAVPANDGGNPTNSDSPTVSGYDRKPAAVIGDAVMLLSNNWNDANSSLTLSNRPASNTTYNTAIVSGFMPSGYIPPSGSQYGYSGGGNNFPRFLENWSSRYCNYFGSMVQLYQSKTFTGRWDTGVIYRPPIRCWNFDPNYRSLPPPGTLDAASWTRGSWAKY
jgi:hypothetical protein